MITLPEETGPQRSTTWARREELIKGFEAAG
jgi:hypothetical protein